MQAAVLLAPADVLPPVRVWMPLFGKRKLRSFGGIYDRTCVRPLNVVFMTPRAGMLFGRLGFHRFRELQALKPRD